MCEEISDIVKKLKENELSFILLKEPIVWVKAMINAGTKYTDTCGLLNNGEHFTVNIYELHYTDRMDNTDNFQYLVYSRASCIKEIYYRWCILRGYKPNLKEGWFKSKKFMQYLNDIDYNLSNYAIFLMN